MAQTPVLHESLVDRLTEALNNHVRAIHTHSMTVADQLRQVVAAADKRRVDEYAPTSGPIVVGTGQLNIDVAPQSSNPEIITSVLVICIGGAGTLTLGPRVIPIPAGTSLLSELNIRMTERETRRLTAAGAGQTLFLELLGYEENPSNTRPW